MIAIDHLSFRYDSQQAQNRWVLKDVGLSVARQDTVAIVGSSGCGKSTMLRIIAGLVEGKAGEQIGHVSVNGQSPTAYRKLGKLAFMFQEPTLLENRNVEDNIKLPLQINKYQDVQATVEDLLNAVGLNQYRHYLPKQLSGGMKTRVALARSFATNPELLLLDEPFSALDVAWRYQLYEEMERLKVRNNTTILLVTHDIEEAFHLTNGKIVVLGSGGVVLHNTQEQGYLSRDEVRSQIIDSHKTARLKQTISTHA